MPIQVFIELILAYLIISVHAVPEQNYTRRVAWYTQYLMHKLQGSSQ